MRPVKVMPAPTARALSGSATGRQPYRTVRYPARIGPNKYIRIFHPSTGEYIDVCPVAGSGLVTATSYFSPGVSKDGAKYLLGKAARLLSNVAHGLSSPFTHYVYTEAHGAIQALSAAKYQGDTFGLALYRPSSSPVAGVLKGVVRAFLPAPSFEKNYRRPGTLLTLREDGEQQIVEALTRLAKKGGKR